MRPSARATWGLLALCLWPILSFGAACGGTGAGPAASALEVARQHADARDPELVAQWLLAEMLAPGGQLDEAARARERLSQLAGKGPVRSLALALGHDAHGRFEAATEAYLEALDAVAVGSRWDAALVGWYAAKRLVLLSAAAPKSWKRSRARVMNLIATPGGIGWRARGELVEWWSRQALRDPAVAKGAVLLDEVAQRHGCLHHGVFAGPFGRGTVADTRVRFEAEEPGPWSARFGEDARTGRRPQRMPSKRHGCLLHASAGADKGIYYLQSFVRLSAPLEVILAVQGAHAIYVDDTLVLERDVASWGGWPRFGVRLRLAAGRHRILARLVKPESSVRLLAADGTPLGLRGSADDGAPYSLSKPQPLAEPNVLDPFMRMLGVRPIPAAPALRIPGPEVLEQPLARFLAASLAHAEGQDDVASVLLEPLVEKRADATPLVLAQQAIFIDGDPIYAKGVARDLARDLRQRAAEADPNLWGPRLWLALNKDDKAKAGVKAATLQKLADQFPEVVAMLRQLAGIYARLGWKAERQQVLELAVERFPGDVGLLEALLSIYESRGHLEGAARLLAKIRAVDPTQEVDYRRALLRQDYPAAIAELRRIGAIRKDRRDIALRIADLLVRAGSSSESIGKLALALQRAPLDAGVRLALADARYASGDAGALTDSLVEAIRTGSEDAALRNAIELVEGMTNLEPHRRDGLKVIAAYERSKKHLPGSAARVLDYGAIWVASDGSARMLEHEIIRVQSREGIQRHGEQQLPRGMVLRMRTIKPDGRVFEPERIAGKPTVTMPHLEVGDYIETESIWVLPGAHDGGRRFLAPRWFFREANTSYHRSEFVVISPASAPALIVETTGHVPTASIERQTGMSLRRWVVEGAVALPEEPLSAPIREFLPSVRVGWGIDQASQLARIADNQTTVLSRDPRMLRIARTIVAGQLAKKQQKRRLSDDEKARRLYRWVVDNIEPGREQSGPRIITSKTGDRSQAFLYLCRLSGVDARVGLVRDRLSPPPRGPFSEAELFRIPIVRLKLAKASRWLVVGDRHVPYGYLPSALRGQPAVMVQRSRPVVAPTAPPLERVTTSTFGDDNRVQYRGEVQLEKNGSALLDLKIQYHGRYAIQLRGVLSKVPQSDRVETMKARYKEILEARVLGLALPGASVKELEVPNLDNLDEPVRLSLQVAVPTFARLAEGGLVFGTPFLGRLERLVALPARESPLYLSERVAIRVSTELVVNFPEGATLASGLPSHQSKDPRLSVRVADRIEGGKLRLVREVVLPAGRIEPKDYPAFRSMVLEADEALNRNHRLSLR